MLQSPIVQYANSTLIVRIHWMVSEWISIEYMITLILFTGSSI